MGVPQGHRGEKPNIFYCTMSFSLQTYAMGLIDRRVKRAIFLKASFSVSCIHLQMRRSRGQIGATPIAIEKLDAAPVRQRLP